MSPLSQKTPNERHKASYTYFKKAVEDPTVLDECDLTPEEKKEILRNISNKMTPTPDKIRADIDVQGLGWGLRLFVWLFWTKFLLNFTNI